MNSTKIIPRFLRFSSSFRDVYLRTELGCIGDIRKKKIEGIVVQDARGMTASLLNSFVPQEKAADTTRAHILVDVGLKFPVSIDCSRARFGRDQYVLTISTRLYYYYYIAFILKGAGKC